MKYYRIEIPEGILIVPAKDMSVGWNGNNVLRFKYLLDKSNDWLEVDCETVENAYRKIININDWLRSTKPISNTFLIRDERFDLSKLMEIEK